MEWCMFRYFLIRVNVNISRLKWKLNKWTIIGEQKFQLFVTSAWLMDFRPIFYARLFDLSTLRFSLNTEQYFWLFFLPDKLFLFSFFSTSWYSHLGHFLFRKWYITFQYFSKFINIKFNIKSIKTQVNFTHLMAFRDEIELYMNISTYIISVKYYIKTYLFWRTLKILLSLA